MLKIIPVVALVLLGACSSSRATLPDPMIPVATTQGNLIGTVLKYKADKLHIYTSYGGFVHQYERLARYLIKNNIDLVIHGRCYSACTMLLDLVDTHPDSTSDVCVYRYAKLGYHSARVKTSKGITFLPLLHKYSSKIQEVILDKGGLPDETMVVLYGKEMLSVYKECG